MEFSDIMFDDIAEKLFLLIVQKRQYGFYYGNLKVFALPSAVPTFTFPPNLPTGSAAAATATANVLPSARGEDLNASLATGNTTAPLNTSVMVDASVERFSDMRYYNELLNSFPAEYISTPIILHCMIEQVSSLT